MMQEDVDCYDGHIGREEILVQCRRFFEYTGFLGMGILHCDIAESGGIDNNDDLVKISAS